MVISIREGGDTILPMAGIAATEDRPTEPLLLFDGLCNFCDASVNFVIDHDPGGRFRFAPLQSEVAKSLLLRHGVDAGKLESVALIEDGKCYTRSTAALRIARRLRGPWPLLYVFIIIPRPLRDLVYDWIARNRYRWFGRCEACRVPTPDTRCRFLESTEPCHPKPCHPERSEGSLPQEAQPQ